MDNITEYSYEKKTTWVVKGIDDKSREILDQFYKTYSVGSRNIVCMAIRKVCN